MAEWTDKVEPNKEKVKTFTNQLEKLKDMLQALVDKDIVELNKAQLELERLEAQKRNQRSK
jgi:hypothetical protein